MKQQCYICKKWYTGIFQHLQRSKCIENARKKNVPAVPFHSVLVPGTDTCENNMNDFLTSDLDMLGMDPVITSNQHSSLMDTSHNTDDVGTALSDDCRVVVLHDTSQ